MISHHLRGVVRHTSARLEAGRPALGQTSVREAGRPALGQTSVRVARPSSLGLARLAWLLVLVVAALTASLSGCKQKVSAKQCEELVDHFSELVVKERFPDAGTVEIAKERARERAEAQGDDAFKNCTSEVQANEHACAMKASSSEAVIKCLE